MLKFYYDISAQRVLDDSLFPRSAEQMHAADVTTLYINSYFYGKWETSPDMVYRAGKRLRENGFEAQILNVPLGHGGNALDPDNPDIPLDCGEGWRNLVTADGRVMPTKTCINDKCIADTKEVNQKLADMGFTKIFLDDDCRLGMWGENLQGCFCDDCIHEFRELTGINLSRQDIINGTPEIKEAWMDFQCGNLIRFLKETKPDGVDFGVMVMHNGDRRHGIDISRMKREIPGTFFRVGEAHFCDREMAAPNVRESILASIHTHMALGGSSANCWSESTVYPVGELSPDNWIKKIKIEIGAGLRNIYLMSGTKFLTDEYWTALSAALPELYELAKLPEPEHKITDFIWDNQF